MKLDDLCATLDSLQLPGARERSQPERDAILAARAGVAAAIVDDEFLVDCISFELRRIENDRLLSSGLEPFFVIPGLGVRFAFGYWAPGTSAGPHEHTAWTITAVCRNELEVLTYDREESYRKKALVMKNRFRAQSGKVGYVYEPCIHDPRNTSDDWSLTLHVSSPRDGERPADYAEILSCLNTNSNQSLRAHKDPYNRVLVTRARQRLLYQLARILAVMETRQASVVIARCRGLASTSTRHQIDLLAHTQDSSDAAEPQWLLVRTHPDLVFYDRCERGLVSLDVETSTGVVRELVMSDIAREAIAIAAKQSTLDVHALPGNLSSEERMEIGKALEETGLFQRLWQ